MFFQLIFVTTFFAVQSFDFGEIIQDNPDLRQCIPSFAMLDASGKIPSGILSGNLLELGSFDQCLSIEEKTDSGTIKGQYCLVKLNLPSNSTTFNHFNTFNLKPKDLAKMILQDKNNPTGLILGWCLPHICPINELTSVLTTALKQFFPGLKIVPVAGGRCQTKDNLINKYNTSNIIFILFLGATLFLIIISTLYDVYLHYSKKKPLYIILTAFSLKTNGQKLLQVNNNSEQLGCLHGIRFLSMIWVILGHRYFIYGMETFNNLSDIESWMKQAENMYILNAPVCVDSFFVLSGLLVSYGYCISKEKGAKFNLISYYIHRYLRLTPALAVVVWFNATILDFFGSGPFWPYTADFKNNCVVNWWATLLYIQNYYDVDALCIEQSWYLSIDMQLFILSPIISIPLWKWPKITLTASSILVMGSMVSSFTETYVKNLASFETGGNMDDYYLVTHTRYGPWLMGLMLGYYLFKLKRSKNNNTLHPVQITLGWAVSLGLLLSTLYGGYDLMLKPTRLGNAFFNGLHRHGWSLGVCWVIYACTQGFGGPVNSFLSWPFFQIIGRFTYTTYLTHMIVQFLMIASARTVTNFSDFRMAYIFWGDFFFSFATGVCLTFAFESPMITLEKLFLKTGRKPARTELSIHEVKISDTEHANK